MNVRILALAGACIIAAGCGGSGAVDVGAASGQGGETGPVTNVSSSSTSATVPGTVPSRMRLEVWLERSGRLWPVVRSVRVTPAVVGAAVSGLLAGPTRTDAADGVRSAVPTGTQLLGISLHGGVATVDLTSEFDAGNAARERLSLAQLVYSVTQFPTVHALRLHLNGQPVTAFADGLVLPDPIDRTSMGFAGLVSPITVTNLRPGASVQAPFTVSGIADVFEAALTYRLLDAAGHELSAGSSAASCGTGCAGTFAFTIDELGVSSAQMGTLVIRGGGQVLRLPLRLVPRYNVLTPAPRETLTSPAMIAFTTGIGHREQMVLVRILDAKFRVLARRVVEIAGCPVNGKCLVLPGPRRTTLHFSIAGLQQGYVVVSPLHPTPNATGQVVEIPVALNGG
jgi:Sporulation and spore germination/Immunoglobulin-like domain of bacterial spore germination